jgi:hypothetical protein
LLSENIKEGVNIFGVIGTLKVVNEASLLSFDEEVEKCNVNFIFNNIYADTLIYFYYLNNQEIIFNP